MNEHEPTHKELKIQKETEWNKIRQENRLHNVSLAHGFIHAAAGLSYFDHGVSRKKRK